MADSLHLDAVGSKNSNARWKRVLLEVVAIILLLVVLTPFIVVLFIVLVVFSLLQVTISKRKEVEA